MTAVQVALYKMEYQFQEFTIEELFNLVHTNRVDLNPSYQRNFIWSLVNQRELIDTILSGYPLPAFFLYQRSNGSYEMVDGQQRTKTIYQFVKGAISSTKKSGNLSFRDIDQSMFLSYRLPIIVIRNLSANESLRDFYVLINKKGVQLNPAEVNKSEFHDTNFLRLATDQLSYQKFKDLNLFTEISAKRMNDRAYVEELLGYLIKGAPKDKKAAVTSLFTTDISEDDFQAYDAEFKAVIDKIHTLNTEYPIANTRYRQKNDFYTLFNFVHQSTDNLDVLLYQYQVLIVLDGKDREGRQFIRPSNEECVALKEYANNCITQSNSKAARDNRLSFFESILKNVEVRQNESLSDVLNYLSSVYGESKIALRKVGEYQLLDVELLK